jgi:peptidoglycan/LPS O-acetylase OafA/YrhL
MATKRGIQYIPAIDGLRALAVIAVMFYHLGFSWIPGGFLGVDLFFVISGYVITRLLLDSIEQSGGLDLRGFYLARARRLLPALLFTVITTTIAIGIWAPDTIKRFGSLPENRITSKVSAGHLFFNIHGHWPWKLSSISYGR